MKPGGIRPALARRIDRLARGAHAFHRYAHHPLCAAYAPERLRLGRTWVCRGCALAAAGGLLGLAAGMLLPSVGLPLFSALLVVTAAAGLSALTGSRWHPRKSLTRFLPAGLAAFLVVQGFRPPLSPRPILAGLVLLGVGVGVLLYRRRGPDRRLCDTCPEASARPSCSGYSPIRQRERAFQRLAARWIDAERAHP